MVCKGKEIAMKIIECLDFRFEHCFTCDDCRYDLDKRMHFCVVLDKTIRNPHTMVCNLWKRKV